MHYNIFFLVDSKCCFNDRLDDHRLRLVSSNDQALDYNGELSIINQKYVQICRIFCCVAST